MSLAGLWEELLEVARWAPSPHNTQPWKLRVIDASRAELLMVRARRLPDEDTTGCFLSCAMGIFIEALRIAARNRGYELRAIGAGPLDLSRELIPFAELSLRAGAEPDEFNDEAILGRRTSRLGCEGSPVHELPERCIAIASAYGHKLGLQTDPAVIAEIMDANHDAVMHDLSDRRYGGEIRGWYRYTRKQAERSRDGLEAGCMNLPPHEMWASAHFPWLMRVPVLRGVMKRLYAGRVGLVPALLTVRGDFFDRGASERAGAMLLRLWLALHGEGLAIHPFGNLVTNAVAHERLTRAVGTEGIWLVARLGRTEEPPRSLRLRAGELIDAG